MSSRSRGAFGRVPLVAAIAVLASACNPLFADPETIGGELDVTAARYSGPPAAWIEVRVHGAPDHVVDALAMILEDELQGPEDRACIADGGTVVPCTVTVSTVQMPNQRVVVGDGSEFARLITAWPGEAVQVVLVCVDPQTQELGCPPTVRTAVRSVDESGSPVGSLLPAPAPF